LDGEQVSAVIWPRTECVTTRQGDAVRQSCTPIADEYDLQLSVDGLPPSLKIELSRDERLVVSDTRAPAYVDREINGSGCGYCRQASYELGF
jgi:hypothetical protein